MTAVMTDPAPSFDVNGTSRHRTRWQRAIRGRESDPVWVRPALLSLLVGTALLYIVGLGASGWANSFYSAAVQAGTSSWKAFFFGSFDSSNFITVDKPPASLWVMELSARVFGVNSWSILVPQALEGVAAVGLLYATVRRRFGAGAGLIAGLVLATTPVATLMFRFNNPDALLVLLLVAAAYAVTRALENSNTRWLVAAGVFVGFGFITKMLQAFLIVPGFGLVYLCYAKTTIRRRIGQLAAALGGIVVGAGWWVAAVMLTPAADRPYIGGSTTNNILQLAFGYNGFGRLTGNETGSVGGGAGGRGGAGGGMWGATGITRLFGSDMGSQISWLIPAALILALGSIWALRRTTNDGSSQRSHVWLWLSWLVVTGLVFSFSKGIIHPYYTVALAPAVGALVGIGGVTLWRHRDELWSRIALSATLVVTVLWSHHLLAASPSWHPWLRSAVVIGCVVVSAAILLPPSWLDQRLRHGGLAIAAGALVVALAGPAAYSLDTASTPYTGAIPSAGPTVTGAGFGRPGAGPGGIGGVGGRPSFRFGGPPGFGPTTAPGGSAGTFPGQGQLPGAGSSTGGAPTGGMPGVGGAGGGGLLNAGTVSSALKTALETNASSYTWVAATIGAENASGYQLATDKPVMAIGGFNGTDNSPTLAQFRTYVTAGRVHYFIASGGGGIGGPSAGGSSSSSAITTWVEANYTATTVGGTTVYDLTAATTAT
jgi:4-amino-4-deoxy-L-arabinose transferase-like glycosyltransferase